MIDMLKVMQFLTEKYSHLAEIRINAQTDTLEYTAQIKVHPHAKGTIQKVFHFRAETTHDEFMENVTRVCSFIDSIMADQGAVIEHTFDSPHNP